MGLRTKGFLTLGVFTVAFLTVIISPHQVQAQSIKDRVNQLGSVNAGACGTVETNSPHDYAGLIVVLGAQSYGKQTVAINEGQRSDGAKVNVSTYGGTSSPPGNVVQLGDGPEGVANRYHDYNFSSRDIRGANASCMGQLVLPGYGNGNWAIDCDISKNGAGNEQKIQAQGVDGTVPYLNGKKLRAGGTWTKSDIVQPKNGKHAVVVTIYNEPAPNPNNEGWNLDTKTKPNYDQVNFTRENVPGGPDSAPSQPSDSKPSGYSEGMDCLGTYGTDHPDAKRRCNLWNRYYTQLRAYQARKQAEDDNRNNATSALNRVEFRHKVGNVGSNGKADWDTVLASDYKATVWKKVIDSNGNVREGWTKRFGNDGNDGKWSSQLGNSVYKLFKGQVTKPPTDTDDALKSMLDNPHQGDKYCEMIVAHPGSSTGGPDATSYDCVTLNPGDQAACEPWQVQGSTYIDGPRDPGAAWVGDTFTAYYSFWKTGPADNTAVINFKHNGGDAANISLPYGGGSWDPNYSIGPFTAQDGGRTFNDYMWYNMSSSAPPNDCGTTRPDQQGPSSVYVSWFYQLHPQVDLNNDTPQIVQQGTPAKVDPLVVLNGNDADRSFNRWNTCADSFDWHLIVTAQKPDTPTVKDHLSAYDRNGHKNARDICPNGNPGDAQLLESGPSVDTTVLPAGTVLCGELTIDKSTESGGSPSTSEKCTTIVKSPKVQFWDSDVNAGRHFQQADNSPTCGEQGALGNADITTSGAPTSVASDNLYGSWVEYGAFASGGISSFGTAAQNKTGGYSIDPTGQRLTFGNDGQLGQFAYTNWCIPNYYKLYQQQSDQTADTKTDSNINLGSLDSSHYYTASQAGGNVTLSNIGNIGSNKQDITIDVPNANVVLSGGTVKPGVRLVVHTSGTVKIDGDIKYSSAGYGSIDNIPRVVVIADGQTISGSGDQQGIVVNDNVKQIDSWLITKQGLYTCTTKPEGLTYSGSRCGDQLVMNGPVAANTLHLRRTFGADLTKPLNERGPGEVFNLNPDSLLGSYSAAQRNYFLDVYQRDVPPRY